MVGTPAIVNLVLRNPSWSTESVKSVVSISLTITTILLERNPCSMEQPNPLPSPSPGNSQANSEGESQDAIFQDSFEYNQLTIQNKTQLDFILIRQKDNILKEINFGNPSVAMAKLKLVKELWENTEYLYKYEELLTKLEHKLKSRLSHG
jgi:hypothetical protein